MIYFLENTFTKDVKIGYTENMKTRMPVYKTHNGRPVRVIGTIPGDKVKEDELHQRFAGRQIAKDYDVGDEWFYGSPTFLQEIDEIIRGPVTLFGHEIKSVYLAGKITGDRWREKLFVSLDGAGAVREVDKTWFQSKSVRLPHDPRKLDYLGPFWFDFSGGHLKENVGPHAMSEISGYSHMGTEYTTDGAWVLDQSIASVQKADLIFAWIDRSDCHGTLAEIAWAYARKKGEIFPRSPIIAIATADVWLQRELWFACGMADFLVRADSPDDAWRQLWSKEVTRGVGNRAVAVGFFPSMYVSVEILDQANEEPSQVVCECDDETFHG